MKRYLLITAILLSVLVFVSCGETTPNTDSEAADVGLQDRFRECGNTWAKTYHADGIVSADIGSCETDTLLMDGSGNFKAAANTKVSYKVTVDKNSFDASPQNTDELYEALRQILREKDILKRIYELELVFSDKTGSIVAISGTIGPDFDRNIASDSADIYSSQTEENETFARTLAYDLCAEMNRQYFSNGDCFAAGEIWMKRFGIKDGELFTEVICFADCPEQNVHEQFIEDLSTLGERICDSLKDSDEAVKWARTCGAERIHAEIVVMWDTARDSSFSFAIK